MPALPPAAAFFVPEVPDLPLGGEGRQFELEAGYLPARPEGRDNAQLYFVLQRAAHRPRRRKLVVWLNGGPGCSSFDGLMMEIGAWRFDAQGKLAWSEPGGSWNDYADVLYLDQPAGTGFSYVENDAYVTSMEQMAQDVFYFLDRFVDVFPEYRGSLHGAHGTSGGVDMYLAGESYAGQYIPYIADALLNAGDRAPVRLKGVAIGNGYIDPVAQYGSEVDMMVQSGVWSAHGPEVEAVAPVVRKCRETLAKDTKPHLLYPECDAIMDNIVASSRRKLGGQEHCLNMYDIRLSDVYPACGMSWPPTLQATYDYLRREDVRKALHVDAKHRPEAWRECDKRVSAALDAHGRNSSASITLLPGILDRGVPVLLFAGESDLICNHIGLRRLVDSLTWRGRRGLDRSARPREWTLNDEHTGTWIQSRNLTYVTISNASHMPAFDRPVAVNDMLMRFLDVEPLVPLGAPPKVSSHLDGDTRVLVAGPAEKLPAQAPPKGAAAAFDNTGSLFVVVPIALAVGLCLFMRNRHRTHRGSLYSALAPRGPNEAPEPLHLGRGPPALDEQEEPLELGQFSIGEEAEDTELAEDERAVEADAAPQNKV